MGVLVDVRSTALELPRSRFGEALEALRELAREDPGALADAAWVLRAEDLLEALATAEWVARRDEAGDLVGLDYGGDKAPPGQGAAWPNCVLARLARVVTKGTFVVHWEGDADETVIDLVDGRLFETTRAREPASARTEPAGGTAHDDRGALAFSALPRHSIGLLWRVTFSFHEGWPWFRERARVRVFVDALAQTALWHELELLLESPEIPPVPIGTVDHVRERVANAQWGARYFHRRDGELSVDLDVQPAAMEIRAHVRDAALSRLGSAAIEGMLDLVRTCHAALAGQVRVRGHAVPFAATPVVRERPDVAARRSCTEAIVEVLDLGREGANADDEHARDVEVLATADVPREVLRAQQGDLVTLRWVEDPRERDALARAAEAHARWITALLETIPSPDPQPPGPAAPPPAATLTVVTTGGASSRPTVPFGLRWRIGFRFLDHPMWYVERSRVARIVDALERTAWWPEVGEDGARARLATGDRVDVTLSHGPEASVSVSTNNSGALELSTFASGSALDRLAARVLTDTIALVLDLCDAYRGRAELTHAHAVPDRRQPLVYARVRPPRASMGPIPLDAVAHVIDLGRSHDGGEAVALARRIAAAPTTADVVREQHDGRVVLRWLDDPSDPERLADACARHERFIVPLVPTRIEDDWSARGDRHVSIVQPSNASPFDFAFDDCVYQEITSENGGVDEAAWARAEKAVRRGKLPRKARHLALVAGSREQALALAQRARAAGFLRVIYREGEMYWDPDPPGVWQVGDDVWPAGGDGPPEPPKLSVRTTLLERLHRNHAKNVAKRRG